MKHEKYYLPSPRRGLGSRREGAELSKVTSYNDQLGADRNVSSILHLWGSSKTSQLLSISLAMSIDLPEFPLFRISLGFPHKHQNYKLHHLTAVDACKMVKEATMSHWSDTARKPTRPRSRLRGRSLDVCNTVREIQICFSAFFITKNVKSRKQLIKHPFILHPDYHCNSL